MDHGNKILIGVIVLFVSLVVAMGSGITALILFNDVKEISNKNKESIERIDNLADELAKLQIESNVASCVAANVARNSVREAVKDSLLALVDPETPLTPEQEVRIELYNERVDSGLPYRDCSLKGIETFLENPPPDPALEEPP